MESEALLLLDGEGPTARDLQLMKDGADALMRAYPGYDWLVGSNERQGIIDVRLGDVDSAYGYTLHLRGLYSATHLSLEIVRAGGEVLERFRLSRAKANPEEIAALPTDFAGRHQPDL